jgi:hypothetical protein
MPENTTVRPRLGPKLYYICPNKYTYGLIDLDLDACPSVSVCRAKGCQDDA